MRQFTIGTDVVLHVYSCRIGGRGVKRGEMKQDMPSAGLVHMYFRRNGTMCVCERVCVYMCVVCESVCVRFCTLGEVAQGKRHGVESITVYVFRVRLLLNFRSGCV
jgi:hypothetical protein